MPYDAVADKFNAYFRFTAALTRCIPQPQWGGYIYPHESMLSDLTVLGMCFIDIYEALGKESGFAAQLVANPQLQKCLEQIMTERGEFWNSDSGSLQQVPIASVNYAAVARALRNGFAHFHWVYGDFNAQDYWTKQRWNSSGAPANFNFLTRPKDNGILYIADAIPPWQPTNFWQMNDLRIVVTNCGTLRFHLHWFLNNVLNGQSVDVFGNPKSF